MKTLILLTFLLDAVLAQASQDDEIKRGRIESALVAVVKTNRAVALVVLKHNIRDGTPLEKDATLYVTEKLFRELLPSDDDLEKEAIRRQIVTEHEAELTNALANAKQDNWMGTFVAETAALRISQNGLLLELVPVVIDAVSDTTPAPQYDDTGWGTIGRHAAWVIGSAIGAMDRAWLKREGDDVSRTLMRICNDTSPENVKARWTEWWQQYHRKDKPQPKPDGDRPKPAP